MLVTIYTDASFKEGNSAGAAWIKSAKGRLTLTATYTSRDPTHAEMQIAYLAIRKALEAWEDVECVFINTDSLITCRYMWPFHKTEAKVEEHKKGVEAINALLEEYGVESRFKHVKGHQNASKGVRAWLNNWCDEQAGKTRRKKF